MMKFKTEGKSIEIVDVREEKKPFVLSASAPAISKRSTCSTAYFSPIPWIPIISRVGKGVIVTLACSRPRRAVSAKRSA
ncbi:MAG: hypothetical protein ACLS4Z_08540 [Christensenellaceae bacterium]